MSGAKNTAAVLILARAKQEDVATATRQQERLTACKEYTRIWVASYESIPTPSRWGNMQKKKKTPANLPMTSNTGAQQSVLSRANSGGGRNKLTDQSVPPVAIQPPIAPELPLGEAQHVTNSEDPCAAAMQADNDHPPSPRDTAPPPPTKSAPLPLEKRLPLANAARSIDVLSPLDPCFP